jgi:thiosulfate dehydrogenase [quinone] large subunit
MSEERPRTQQLGWVLLPLRAFLAIVYLDGGISKIADRRFLDGSSPTSMHASVLAVKSSSPIGGLLGPVADHSYAFGILMAIAEIAVGLGTLLGLWTRIAAAGGMVLALSLWLTISWNASPWFTSADVVYLFAFTPLVLAGAAGVLSLDGWLDTVAVRHPGRSEDRTRRSLITVGAWVLQLTSGNFTALDAVCPHQGCPVSFVSAKSGFECPCHQSTFSATGDRKSGPAPRGLTKVPVTVQDGVVRRT